MADYTMRPRPPWLYNTPYLQDYYRQNQAAIDAQWQAWVAQHPEDQNLGMTPGNQMGSPFPPMMGGGGQQFGGGGMPQGDLSPTPYGPYGGGNMPTPYGPYGSYPGSSYGGAGGGGWYNSPWGQIGINTGLNLIGGLLQNRAQGKANKANQRNIDDRIRAALAVLSPAQITALAQQFMPQAAANASAAGQTAISGLREVAAKRGLAESPYALSAEAGLRAKLANDVQTQAFNRAFNVAGQQAGVLTGTPIYQQQPQTGLANAFTNSANQAYNIFAWQQANNQSKQSPYRMPGQYVPGVPYGFGRQL